MNEEYPKIVNTIILRFRDLSVPENQTIDRHKRIIEDNGYVWWGWWKKHNENPPMSLFKHIRIIIEQEGKLDILLVDSGSQDRVYTATCEGLEYKDELIDSPEEGTKTPSYYQETKLFCWFKFSTISPIKLDAQGFLNKYSYIESHDIFSNESPYKDIDNKQVSSHKELRHQNRTLWPIRNYRKEDKVTEFLYRPNSESIENFHTEFVHSKSSNTFLWLSDIHFGSSHGFVEQMSSGDSESLHKTLENKIINAVRQHLSDSPTLAGIIISGDFTTKGDVEGFNNAASLIKTLVSLFSLHDMRSVIICPGNHDLSFEKEDTQEGDPNESVVKNFKTFYKKIYGINPSKSMSMGRCFLLKNATPLEIVSINTNNYIQTPNYSGHSFVGEAQLEEIKENFFWNSNQETLVEKEPHPVRIVVGHHQYIAPTYNEGRSSSYGVSSIQDGDRLAQWMYSNNVSLYMHGHKHQDIVAKVSRPVTEKGSFKINEGDKTIWKNFAVAGLGSTGCGQGERGSNSNQISLISVTNRNIKIKWINIYPDKPKAEIHSTVQIPTQPEEY